MLRALIAIFPIILSGAEIVSFPSGDLTLRGVLYKPEGPSPFPAVLFNHGSGQEYSKEFQALGEVFARRGWVFFAPYRRGQGLSSAAGAYIADEIDKAQKAGGVSARSDTIVRILETDHLNDQLAGLAWLKKSGFVDPARVAVAGNSFGGIQAVLGAERGSYCAAIDSAGAAGVWSSSPSVQALMIRAVRNAKVPIFFFQAENDSDLAPSRTLAAAAESAGRRYQLKIYPPFGTSKEEGHGFGYFGSSIWADDVFKFLNDYCIVAAAEAQENTFGIWTLNVAKSKLPDGFISGVKIEEPSGPNSVRDTVEWRTADGRTRLSINPSVRLDGTENTLEQTTIITDSSGKQQFVPYNDMRFRYQRIDKNSARYVIKQNGKVIQAGERILSADRKTLTETHNIQMDDQITPSCGRGWRAPNDAVVRLTLLPYG